MDGKTPAACAIFAGLVLLAGCARDESARASKDAAELALLRDQVAYLEDRQDIADTLQRYIRGIDRHDKELARSAFWPDAHIDMGTPNTRDEYIDREEAALATYARHQHHITGQTVDIQGDTAHVESYVWFIAVPRDASKDTPGPAATPGRPLVTQDTQLGSGRYIERWEKRNGEWKIAVREYVHDVNTFGKTDDYCARRPCLTRWDKKDLSYTTPLEPLTPEERSALAESNKETHGRASP
ncbi:MAG TPA: nuclear transport factor 2 family protein [Steroidobacteraceae bacterium]|nr:nuclear transport factor 2 family protein [Steroidobacteraceae bacterium]